MSRLLWAALALILAGPLAAREPARSYRDVLIARRGPAIEVRLPLTDVTGKVRVKARLAGQLGQPVAPARTALGATHYLEWQIGYDTGEPGQPAMADGVKFLRQGKVKFGHELSRILQEALRAGLLSAAELRGLREELPKLSERSIEQTERIALQRAPGPENGAARAGFERWLESVPLLMLETPHGWVQIELKPKQRAVGLQPMLYLCLPFQTWHDATGAPRTTGPARAKETVRILFDREAMPLLLATVRGFGASSRQHAEDLGHILEAILDQQ